MFRIFKGNIMRLKLQHIPYIANKISIDLGNSPHITLSSPIQNIAQVALEKLQENVKAEMAIPSRLLEHVCGRITDRLFRNFPQIEEITLKLAKRNPPMGADIETAGIEVRLNRPL